MDLDGPIIDLEQGWHEIQARAIKPLEHMLDDGFSREQSISRGDYAAAYTMCYNMCTQRSPHNWSEQLYGRHKECIGEYLETTVLTALEPKRGEELLKELSRRWENHRIMNRWMKNFFSYLDRYQVNYNNELPLVASGLALFRNVIYCDETLRGNVTAAILDMIEEERGGSSSIDRDLIRSCVSIYIAMGDALITANGVDSFSSAGAAVSDHPPSSNIASLTSYISDLENPLLVATRAYYTQKVDIWIRENSTPAYLTLVEQALDAEQVRCRAYLTPHTEKNVLSALDEVCLEIPLMELLQKEGSGCAALLVNNMVDDLRRMFQLLSRLSSGLAPMCEIFSAHIIKLGLDRIQQRTKTLEELPDKEREKDVNGGAYDPQFVKDLLALHEKYSSLINNHFSGHGAFQKALTDAFSEIVNKELQGSKVTMADVLASFCDRILKTGGEKLSDSDVEDYLEKTVQLFSYLSDKDVFADIYRNQLAKRILNHRSNSDDMERTMVSKLKLRCGSQFTGKMEGMLNDLAVASEHQQEFLTAYEEVEQSATGAPPKVDFSVNVLTTGHWPTYRVIEINLPMPMANCCKIFSDYYTHKTAVRRLQWTFSLGNASVKGTFGSSGRSRTYDFQVVTLQAAVMLAFNINDTWSFEALLAELKCPEEILKKLIHSLACGKLRILKKIPAEGNAIRNTDSFTFNDAFTCQMRKVRIPVAVLDDTGPTRRIEEDRGHAIEAAAVRIMKARKVLSHQLLVGEVLSQLSFFQPNPRTIKRKLEHLIEREFLERDPDDPGVYRYLA